MGVSLAAIAVICDGCMKLGSKLCPDQETKAMLALTASLSLAIPDWWMTPLCLFIGALSGAMIFSNEPATPESLDKV